jgi:hypothetical protein
MGSSPRTTYIPTPSQSVAYRSMTPEQDLRATADLLNRKKEETNVALNNLYAQGGTPAELGAQQAQTKLQAASTYLASLPKASTFDKVRDTSEQLMTEEQKKYLGALAAKNTPAPPAYSDTTSMPSWTRNA